VAPLEAGEAEVLEELAFRGGIFTSEMTKIGK